MSLGALLFDLDGTLVDSNPLHVEAWADAFRTHGYHVAADRIGLEIGKGGDQLVADVLGHAAERTHGERLRTSHGRAYARLARARGIPVLRGAERLLLDLRARGIRTALATSSSSKDVKLVEEASGVAWSELVDVVACASDAARSKPEPDIVTAALAKLERLPTEAALVGDTIYDARAGTRAGLTVVGLSGAGTPAIELVRAGARVVRSSLFTVRRDLDEVLEALSPAPVLHDGAFVDALVAEALRLAKHALELGEVPIAAVVARGDGRIVGRGWNRSVATGDLIAHAEIVALRAARKGLAADADTKDMVLASTLEPCVMCTGAAMEVSLDTVVFGLAAPADSGTARVRCPESVENRIPRLVGGFRAAESRALFQRWLRSAKRDRRQEPYVRQLLALT